MYCKQCGEAILAPDDVDICSGCKLENDDDEAEIKKLVDAGHTQHCAERQVWGDGGCECGIEKYEPYAWCNVKA